MILHLCGFSTFISRYCFIFKNCQVYKYGAILVLTETFLSEHSHRLKNIIENALGKLFLPHYHVNIPYSWVDEWVTVKGRWISTHRFNKLRDFLEYLLAPETDSVFFHILKVTPFNHILLPEALWKTG